MVSLLEVRVKNLDDARKVADELVRRAGPGYHATTWMDENRALFRALSLEKLVTALFIGLITFVAGLNILVVLTMTVTDRAQGYRGADGRGRAAHGRFAGFSFCRGSRSASRERRRGLAAGFGFSWVANRWQLIPLNPEVYAIPYVPFHANGTDAIWIAVAALAISIAATVLPARSASNILPVEILRFE